MSSRKKKIVWGIFLTIFVIAGIIAIRFHLNEKAGDAFKNFLHLYVRLHS